jgi:hypothetical protein
MACGSYDVRAARRRRRVDAEGEVWNWRPRRHTFLFLSATRGFKSGGVNNLAALEPGTAYRPELAWSYEAGVKRTLPGGRGRVNAALFYVDYRDLQIQSFFAPGIVDVSNAPATSKGIEVEAAVSPGPAIPVPGDDGLARCRLRAIYRRRAQPDHDGGGQARWTQQATVSETPPDGPAAEPRSTNSSQLVSARCPSGATSRGRAACSSRRPMRPCSRNRPMPWCMRARRSCRANRR